MDIEFQEPVGDLSTAADLPDDLHDSIDENGKFDTAQRGSPNKVKKGSKAKNKVQGDLGSQEAGAALKLLSQVDMDRLLHFGLEMPLFQDRVDGEFFLTDGDSLLMEAANTTGWQFGQQLHLFYIAESILSLLAHHGGTECRALFLPDIGAAAWRGQPLMQLFRRALQLHLTGNCAVNCDLAGISSCFDASWVTFLQREAPLFVLLHDGCDQTDSARNELQHLAVSSLACGVPIVYTGTLVQVDMKLQGYFVQRAREHKIVFEMLRKARCKSGNAAAAADVGAEKKLNSNPIYLTGLGLLKNWLAVRTAATLLSTGAKQDQSSVQLASACCLYFACMSTLTFEDRLELAEEAAAEQRAEAKGRLVAGMESLELLATAALTVLLELKDLAGFSDPESVADLIDPCVYWRFCEGQRPIEHGKAQLIMDTYHTYTSALAAMRIEAPLNAPQLRIAPVAPEVTPEATTLSPPPKLQRIAGNSLVDSYAGDLVDRLGPESLALVPRHDLLLLNSASKAFDERRHWHCNQELRDDLDERAEPELSSNPSRRKRQLQDMQKFKRYLRMYGDSLHSETSETVVVDSGEASAAAATAPAASGGDNKKQEKQQKQQEKQQKQPKQQQNKPGKGASKKDAIIAANQLRKADDEMKKLKEQWRNLLPRYKSLEPKKAIDEAMPFIDSCTVQGKLYDEPVLFVMQQQYLLWKRCCTADAAAGSRSYAHLADLVHLLHKYCTEPLVGLVSPDLKAKIAEYFFMIGFKDAAPVADAGGPDKFKGVPVEPQCQCPIGYRDFQMLHMGHLMQRNIRFDPDPRVKTFIPDTWQRELLDVVDRRESAVIVAPTSSGKTFCSYYCMKKVLEMSDDAVIVYVAPTKALVNQVQASVTAKFSKPGLTAGIEVCGVFTRDYAHKAQTCQILVTVPQCLELLLLSPRRQGWARKIRYVIFDEVHCIGTGIGGVVWEYLICLIRCPFLALSATIGNKDFFHDWLTTVKLFTQRQDEAGALEDGASKQPGSGKSGSKRQQLKQKAAAVGNPGYKVNLVTYSERYSDIRTSVYLPGSGSIVEVNPCVFLSEKLLTRNGFPNNLKLSPKESHEVLSAAAICFNGDRTASDALDKLRPQAFFGSQPISRTRFRELEVGLKDKISELLKSQPSAAKSSALLEALKSNSIVSPAVDTLHLSDKELVDNFPALIDRLRSEGRLPVLVFMNNRNGIENLAWRLLNHARQLIKSNIDTKLIERIERGKEALAALARKGRDNKDSDSEDQDNQLENSAEFESYYRDKLEYRDKIRTCAYFSPNGVSDDTLKGALERIEDEDVQRLFEMGIGFHHAGCSLKHRQAVEMLFRCGYMQVVTATATLALGIHMPCKTVIFAGDDKYLDALNYHQMAGRSGRRGFDNIGNVVFYGVPASKISHLIQADLPELKGGFPLTCAFVLRLLLLTGNATDPQAALSKAATVLSRPFVGHNRPELLDQLKLYFLFSLEFLRGQNLIDDALFHLNVFQGIFQGRKCFAERRVDVIFI